jgi:multidrug efflux system membrane fusion protein
MRLAAVLWLSPLVAVAAGFDASIGFARRVEVGVPVSGVVARVGAQPGARVAPGTVLVALDDTPFQAALERAQGQVARAGADHDEAVRDHKHTREIYERQMASTVELDNARLKVVRADAALKEARARLKQAQYELARARIQAPFDAWVLEMRVQAGQSVVAALESRPLVVLAAYGEYLASARVPAATAQTLTAGQSVTVVVGNKRHGARVQSIGLEPSADQAGKEPLYTVVAVFSAPEAVLRAGQGARVELP